MELLQLNYLSFFEFREINPICLFNPAAIFLFQNIVKLILSWDKHASWERSIKNKINESIFRGLKNVKTIVFINLNFLKVEDHSFFQLRESLKSLQFEVKILFYMLNSSGN